MDARGCPTAIAHTSTQQDADDVLALKEHPPTLYEDVTLLRQAATAHHLSQVASQREATVEADHGRLEMWTYWITSDIEWLGAKASWLNLPRIGLVEAHRAGSDHRAEDTRMP